VFSGTSIRESNKKLFLQFRLVGNFSFSFIRNTLGGSFGEIEETTQLALHAVTTDSVGNQFHEHSLLFLH
jgi:hypothetical protein